MNWKRSNERGTVPADEFAWEMPQSLACAGGRLKQAGHQNREGFEPVISAAAAVLWMKMQRKPVAPNRPRGDASTLRHASTTAKMSRFEAGSVTRDRFCSFACPAPFLRQAVDSPPHSGPDWRLFTPAQPWEPTCRQQTRTHRRSSMPALLNDTRQPASRRQRSLTMPAFCGG